jgi:hypothetical protein
MTARCDASSVGGAGSVIGPRVNRYIAVPGLGMVSWYAGIGTDTTDETAQATQKEL